MGVLRQKNFMDSIIRNKGAVALIALAVQLSFAQTQMAFAQLPLDTEGWSVFTPSSDSRIVYVSSSGNDATAQYYLPADAAIGSDPFNPIGPVNSYQTIAAAMLQMREFYPDWTLLNRGDTLYQSLSSNLQGQSGRSATEVKLFSAYGTGERPLLKTGIDPGFNLSYTTSQLAFTTDNIAIAHLDFHAHTRDPESPDFTTTANGAQGGSGGFRIVKSGSNISIEGCKFSYYTNNSVQVSPGATNRLVNFKLRRNVISHNYRNVSGGAHCQGIFTGSDVDSMLIEENVFWHNGWSEDPVISSTGNGAPATIFNRNAYLNRGEDDLIVRGNIFAESSSEGVQQRSGGIAEDNLCLKNSAGILFGQWQAIWPDEAVGGIVRNNVCLDAQDIDESARGGGIQFEQVDGVEMYNNVIAHQRSGTWNIAGISLANNFLNVNVFDNIVYDWSRPNWPDLNDTRATALSIGSVSTPANVTIRNNEFQQPETGFTASSAVTSPPGVTLLNNTYYSGSPDPPSLWSNGWFQIGSSVTSTEWSTQMNDPTSVLQQVNYSDPSRTIETYMTTQLGTPTLTAFMEEATQQRKDYWRNEYTSFTVNCYIREGFRTPITFASSPDTITICEGEGATLSVSNLNINNYSLSWNGGAATTDTTYSITPVTTTLYTLEVSDSTQLWKTCTPTTHEFLVVVDICLGIEESDLGENQLQIYPNPSNGKFTIEFTANILEQTQGNGSSLEITNALGEIVHQSKIASSKSEIDLSHQPTGIYFYKLQIGEKIQETGKVIIE
ncbi:MAG: hypothetical protein ACI85F_001922 [Bacteroidia bacterium]|jgi:hypothetical protein